MLQYVGQHVELDIVIHRPKGIQQAFSRLSMLTLPGCVGVAIVFGDPASSQKSRSWPGLVGPDLGRGRKPAYFQGALVENGNKTAASVASVAAIAPNI
jgi:hypothetical protein